MMRRMKSPKSKELRNSRKKDTFIFSSPLEGESSQNPSDLGSSDEDSVTSQNEEPTVQSSVPIPPVELLSLSETSALPTIESASLPLPVPVPVAPVVTMNETVIRQVALPDIPLLPKTASKRLIAQWISQVSNPLMTQPYHLYLTLEMRALIEIKFAAFFEDNPHETSGEYDKLSKEEFCRILTLVFSDVVLGTAVNLTLSRRLKNADVVRFSLADPDVENTTVVDISNIVKEFVTPSGVSTISDSMHLESVKVLNESLPKMLRL
jgi:hypothetical protein